MTGPLRIFDASVRDHHRRRALRHSVAGADFLLQAVAEDVRERLGAVKRRFAIAAEISPQPVLAGSEQIDRIVRIDRLLETAPDIAGDEELLPLAPQSVDLVVSVLSLHLVNDLPGALA